MSCGTGKFSKTILVVGTIKRSGSQRSKTEIKKYTDIRSQSRQWGHVFGWSKWEKSIQKTIN